MTLNQIASFIAKHEGKKSQASIGDIREILKIIITESSRLSDDRVLLDLAIIKLAEAQFNKNEAKAAAKAAKLKSKKK